MSLRDFLTDLDTSVNVVTSADFEIEVVDTEFVPSIDDPNITYDNLDSKKKRCKRLESCVLYVDIRNSAKISAVKQPRTLAKMYSSFVRTMIACARYYGGHVRNIIGDRVMVVFDKKDCFTNAMDTAILMNSVCKYILNRRISSFEFSAGIGIDHGNMLITKSGAIRQGNEKEFYRSLVWLGKPANTASRLTDLANKIETHTIPTIRQGTYYPYSKKWHWTDRTYFQFVYDLELTSSSLLKHKDNYFCSFYKSSETLKLSYSPILITDAVYRGLKAAVPNSELIQNGWFSKETITVKDYNGIVYGGDVIYSVVKDI
jgi:class 3 adenylate cyclase